MAKRIVIFLLWLVGGAAVGAACAFVAVVLAGGGHGTYYAAKILFPYSMMLTGSTRSITPPLAALALLQYPAYAIALWALANGSLRQERWWILLGLHACAVVLAFFGASSSFTP